MGPHPAIAADLPDTDAAIARALDLSGAAATPLGDAPPDVKSGKPKVRAIVEPIGWWVDRMQQPDRLVEERLTWFWHDHFATSRGQGAGAVPDDTASTSRCAARDRATSPTC